MREFKIAVASSRKAGKWTNTTMTWLDLCARIRKTFYTAETSAEYWGMTKDERDAAKDRGGFVGGYLKNGRRKITDVECRSLITHDVDDPDPGFFDRFTQGFKYAAVLYSTHSHLSDRPRYRVVIPLEEDIPPERYAAVSRYIAAEYGIDQYDPVSFVTNQLMHWPTTSKDAEYVCKVLEGRPFLDADEYLAEHPGWQDYSQLPYSSREKKARMPDARLQEDPLTKEGIVGAFCRVYSIHDVIQKFLSDVYAPSVTDDRYDYIPGEGSCGVVIYDDKFAYSHHATDPAGGKTSNAFDLVRWHRFGDADEKTSFLKMKEFAENDKLVKETLEKEQLKKAQEEFQQITSNWEEPIPFGRYELEPFPVEALPPDIGDYVKAVAESTQTPVDMGGTAALALISVCIQGKYVIQGKPGWMEPPNLYVNIIAPPSERKSAVLRAIVKPGDDYETQYNTQHQAQFTASELQKRILDRRQSSIVDLVSKGKADPEEVEKIAQEIANFREVKPLQLYVDDITTEKLVSVMAAQNGRAALISSEGGIFDTLAGIYSKNVNIDVMLKAFSGDTIRVDRINRGSECIKDPSLTVLLMTQPKVISDVLANVTFRGRGLTARFLYSLPVSSVGKRRFRSEDIPEEAYRKYQKKIINMLEEEYQPRPEVITLSPEANGLLEKYANDIEPKLKDEYADIAGWAGKLVGNTLRIAALLCRAGVYHTPEFLGETQPLVVSGKTMEDAIRLGRYFLKHAMVVFDVVPESVMNRNANRILDVIRKRKLRDFSRRDAMRYCQIFKTVAEIQPVLDYLEDYGYLARQPEKSYYGGRPPLPKYVVNPWVLSCCHN